MTYLLWLGFLHLLRTRSSVVTWIRAVPFPFLASPLSQNFTVTPSSSSGNSHLNTVLSSGLHLKY